MRSMHRAPVTAILATVLCGSECSWRASSGHHGDPDPVDDPGVIYESSRVDPFRLQRFDLEQSGAHRALTGIEGLPVAAGGARALVLLSERIVAANEDLLGRLGHLAPPRVMLGPDGASVLFTGPTGHHFRFDARGQLRSIEVFPAGRRTP